MSRKSDLTPSIAEEAAEWWVVFHDKDEQASAADHREFAAWVTRSPERMEAYLTAAQVDHALKKGEIKWPTTPIEPLLRETRRVFQDELKIRRSDSVPVTERARSWPLRLSSGLATACFLAAVTFWFVMRPLELQTRVGEQRSVLLADGSHITLNTGSTVEIYIRRNRRLARLIRGEALFEVSHDESRPFEVTTPQATLRDVGTKFNVDERTDTTTVTVIEGKVLVEPVSSAPTNAVPAPILTAAQRLTVSSNGLGAIVESVNLKAALAWTEQRLIFERRPLREVAAEFNRYNPDQIQIGSADLGDQTITGTFQANGTRSFTLFLEQIPGVEVRDDPKGNHVVTFDAKSTTPQ